MSHRSCLFLCVLSLVAAAKAAGTHAADVLFTEDFTNSSANWANFNSTNFLTHFASGGPDGGAYASGPRSFQGLTAGNLTVILRARHDNPWNSSGDAFTGSWIDRGIREVRAFVRHDVPDPVEILLRAAGPLNFPGHVYTTGVPVQPGVWTELVFDTSINSPDLVSPEGGTWSTLYSDVGHLQIGAYIPAGYGANATAFNFDVDKVSILTPEPTTLALGVVGLFGAIVAARRRRIASQLG